jgi:hypothetical protein
VLGTVALVGCTSTASTAISVTTRSTTTTAVSLPPGRFEVLSLNLRFTLATTFQVVQNPSFAFLAHNLSPQAVFSIDGDGPAVTEYSARPGESLSTADLGGLHNVVVTHAAISGLPAGIDANELLVSNATRSFSLIMSATAANLPAMWKAFITSVHVDPA